MEFIFVDESSDSKFKDYFGLCVAAVNSVHYRTVKQEFQALLRSSTWNETIEFKGSHLFSATKGDTSVSVEDRIEIAKQLLDLNSADKNSRFRFHYAGRHDCNSHKDEYLAVLPALVHRSLVKAKKGRGRDLVSVSCDRRDDISPMEIQTTILPAIEDRGYTLVEEVTAPLSNFNTVGILYADIVSYLSARIETIENDVELFESIPDEMLENNGKIRKLRTSTELIERVKRLDRYVIQG